MLARLMVAVLICAGLGAAARAETPPEQRPFLRIEPGMHTAPIRRIGVDAACTLMVTGSNDKTARLWALPPGGRGRPELLRTLRVPIGEGNDGKVYAVAMPPDGKWVAAGGWNRSGGDHWVYIFEAASGRLVTRLGELGDVILNLAFSPDGRRLAATLGGGEGMRLWETGTWRLLAGDKDYGGKDSYGAAFGGGGRLFTVAFDGQIRRYGAGGRLEAKEQAQGAREPFNIAVHPGGGKLAIGFIYNTAVEVYGADTLKRLYAAGTAGISGGDLGSVAWSADGARLYAGGRFQVDNKSPVVIWQNEGRGKRTEAPLSQDTIMQLLPCGGGIAAGAADPAFGLIAADGAKRVWQEGVTADMRNKLRDDFTLSADGRRVRFGLGVGGKQPVLFDLAAFRLTDAPEAVAGLAAHQTSGLAVSDWENSTAPKLDGKAITLEDNETSRSLTIAPGVNINRYGRLIAADYYDGTIRWHRLSDGQELLALFVHAKDRRFVAWTPKGYYAASPGAEDLIGWHVNRDWEHAADFFPASRFRDQFNRPGIVRRVLDDLDEDTAIAEANRLANVKPAAQEIRKIQPPVVTILSPADGASVSARTLTVTYSVRSPSGLPLKNVRALIDGRPVDGGVETKGFEQVKYKEQTFSLTVEAPTQDFELSLIAEAEGAAPSEPSRVRLKWAGRRRP